MQATSNKVATQTPMPIPSKKVCSKMVYSPCCAPKWAVFYIIRIPLFYIKSWLAAFFKSRGPLKYFGVDFFNPKTGILQIGN